MDYRSLVVLGACLAAGSVPLLSACKGPDPGAITFQERDGTGADNSSGGGSSTSGAATSTSSSGATPDGGTSGSAEPFFGAEAFAFPTDAPPSVVNAQTHGAETAPMQGKECTKIGCHGDGTGGAPKWGAGGSVYGDVGGGAFPADLKQKVELRIVTSDNKEWGTFYPDNDGNFYLDKAGDFPPAGSKVAIRTQGGAVKPMSATIEGQAGANCSAAGCHATMKIVAK